MTLVPWFCASRRSAPRAAELACGRGRRLHLATTCRDSRLYVRSGAPRAKREGHGRVQRVMTPTTKDLAVASLMVMTGLMVVGCGDDNSLAPSSPTAPTTTDSAPQFQSGTLTLQPGERYTVGTAVNVTLPAASGGDPPLTYGLSPSLPSGLSFNAAGRTISGTPTAESSHTEYAYTATDRDGDSATIRFGITVVRAPTTGSSSGTCFVGQELRPGDSCTVGSDRFQVLSDGRGRYGCCITAGTGININGFRASRISGTDNWRIDALP